MKRCTRVWPVRKTDAFFQIRRRMKTVDNAGIQAALTDRGAAPHSCPLPQKPCLKPCRNGRPPLPWSWYRSGRFQHTAVSCETARIEAARRRVLDIRQDFCV
jgi:hypothetical protein